MKKVFCLLVFFICSLSFSQNKINWELLYSGEIIIKVNGVVKLQVTNAQTIPIYGSIDNIQIGDFVEVAASVHGHIHPVICYDDYESKQSGWQPFVPGDFYWWENNVISCHEDFIMPGADMYVGIGI
jgi:hypothetical protein